jgi:hypothetical protein
MGWFIGITLGLIVGWFVLCCAVGWMAAKDPLWDTPDGTEEDD